MLSFHEALEEDRFPAVCVEQQGAADEADGWEVHLRRELRLFAGVPCDVRLGCRDGRAIGAHRAVLEECGSFEALLFESDASVLEVDEESSILFEVVRWIYCQDAALDKDSVFEVFRVAELYGIESLVDQCSRVVAALSGLEGKPAVCGPPGAAAKLSAETGSEEGVQGSTAAGEPDGALDPAVPEARQQPTSEAEEERSTRAPPPPGKDKR